MTTFFLLDDSHYDTLNRPLSGPAAPPQIVRARSPGIRVVSQPIPSNNSATEQTIPSNINRSRSPHNHRHSLSATPTTTESPAPIYSQRSPLLMPRDQRLDHPPPPLPARGKSKVAHSREPSDISELHSLVKVNGGPSIEDTRSSVTSLPPPKRWIALAKCASTLSRKSSAFGLSTPRYKPWKRFALSTANGPWPSSGAATSWCAQSHSMRSSSI